MRMITARFIRVLLRYTDSLCTHYRFTLQQVMPLSKTCNRLPGNIPEERGNVAWGIKRRDVQSSLGSWQHGDVLNVERHRTRSRLCLHGGKMRRVQPSFPRSEHDPLLLVFLTSCHVFGLAVPHQTLKGFP